MMASTASHTTFAPYQPSPLARTTSPFKDPRTPPRTPLDSGRIWDEYERRAVENAKRREAACASPSLKTPQSQRLSSGTVLDIIKSYDPHSSPRVPAPSPTVPTGPPSAHFDFGFQTPTPRKRVSEPMSTTLAICKSCQQSITSLSGICERCKRTIVLSSMPRSGETTPPLTPACRNFASTDLPKLHRKSTSGTTTPTSSSPKRRSRRTPSTQLELPIRLASLRPPPSNDNNTYLPPPRKCSLTDPNEPFLRLQISRKPVAREVHPSSPITPPSTSHSNHTSSTSNPRTRPPSLANITTPPQYAPYPRHTSATPSELSTLYPYISSTTTTTSPPSVCRASYSLQNTTSAWDDSDSEGEEKGLVGYWRSRKWRGSRGSLGNANAGSMSMSMSMRRGSEGRRDSKMDDSAKEEVRRRRRGAFVRVISCGCHE